MIQEEHMNILKIITMIHMMLNISLQNTIVMKFITFNI